MLMKDSKKFVYLADYIPITSYVAVFESIWNRDIPCSYVLDMKGVEHFESGMLGLVVLFKQYVAEHNQSLEIRNQPQQWPKNKLSLLL